MAKKTIRPHGIDGHAELARQLKDPAFRYHFEQRRLMHEVAIAVRDMRVAAGLTQAELAAKIETSQPTIARLERGQGTHTPQWDTLRRIAIALGRQLRVRFAQRAGELVEVERLPKRRAARGESQHAAR